MISITRKFLVKILPDLSDRKCLHLVRFYLYRKNGVVVRIQSTNNETFELERKSDRSDLVRESQSIAITMEEFEALKSFCAESIERDSYLISEIPKVVLRVYKGKYEGLNRVEVNFNTENEASKFSPFEWFGKEITTTLLAKESTLLNLSKDELQKLLQD